MRYRAFISYASADRAVGERFQRAIEWYKIPKPLRGLDFGRGVVPTRIAPLFRDRSDAEAGPLSEVLKEALSASEALIVLCSPTAARSRWVNAEIQSFKALGRSEHIFPVLIEGAPKRFDGNTCPDGAFPPALFERFDAASNRIAGDDPEPLAPDIRDSGDGFHTAKLKVVAALTGIPLVQLTQRQQEAERRERLIVRWVAAGMAVLAVSASVAAWQAWQQADYAGGRLDDAIRMAASRVDDASQFGDHYGVPSEVSGKLLKGAEADFDKLVGAGADRAPTLQLERARLLQLFSRMHGVLGQSAEQLTRARQALRVVEGTSFKWSLWAPRNWFSRFPRAEEVQAERLNALETLGNALALADGDTTEALKVYEQGRDLAITADDKLRAGRFWSMIGMLRYGLGDVPSAAKAFEEALALLDLAAKGGPEDQSEAREERAIVLTDYAEMLLETNKHVEASRFQSRATDEFAALALAAPNDTHHQRQYAQALVRLGDMKYAESGAWIEALKSVQKGVEILDRVYRADTNRMDIATDLSKALDRESDAHLQMANTLTCPIPSRIRSGDLALDMREVEAANAIVARVRQLRTQVLNRDSENEEYRRNFRIMLEREAEIANARRDPARALRLIEEARSMMPCGDEPASDGEQDLACVHDLTILINKSAFARWRAGRGDWATEFRTAIERLTPLTRSDQASAGWVRDLYAFHFTYGDALDVAGQRADARSQWTTASELAAALLTQDAGDPRIKRDVACIASRLAVVTEPTPSRKPRARRRL